MAYVEPTSRTTGFLVTASVWNQDVVANVIALAATRTVKFFVQSVGSADSLVLDASSRGFELPDGVTRGVQGFFMVPNDYVSGMTVKPVVVSETTGDVRLSGSWFRSPVGAGYGGTTSSQAQAVFAVTAEENTTPYTLAESGTPAAGDICRLILNRFGGDASDTTSDILNVAGWIVQYTASNYG